VFIDFVVMEVAVHEAEVVLSIINYVFETGTQVHGDIITLINID
jgi:hypothetical protein